MNTEKACQNLTVLAGEDELTENELERIVGGAGWERKVVNRLIANTDVALTEHLIKQIASDVH